MSGPQNSDGSCAEGSWERCRGVSRVVCAGVATGAIRVAAAGSRADVKGKLLWPQWRAPEAHTTDERA